MLHKAQSGIRNNAPWSEDESHLLKDMTPENREKLLAWTAASFIASDDVMTGRSSYSMKGLFTKETGIYIYNNQFKDAMLQCGFKPDDETELNWHYRLHRRSPAFARDYIRSMRLDEDRQPMLPDDEHCGFFGWMMASYLKDDTPEGDLARDMQDDLGWPHSDEEAEQRAYLTDRGACAVALSTFSKCRKKYDAWRGKLSDAPANETETCNSEKPV